MSELHKNNIDLWSSAGDMVQRYWNHPEYINRSKEFAQRLKKYQFSSVYEVGMCNGRNLKYISDEFPEIKIGGCDVNKVALEFAKNNIPNVLTDHADILNLETSEKFDIVFTHGVLMHTLPESINAVIEKIIDKANKYIIHMEKPEKNGLITRGPNSIGKKTSKRFVWQPNISDIYVNKGFKILEKENCTMGMPKNPIFYLVIEK